MMPSRSLETRSGPTWASLQAVCEDIANVIFELKVKPFWVLATALKYARLAAASVPMARQANTLWTSIMTGAVKPLKLA